MTQEATVQTSISTTGSTRLAQVAQVARATVAVGERAVVAVHDDGTSVTLQLGQSMGNTTRAGAVVARLLVKLGAWWVVSITPDTSSKAARRLEREAAERVQAAARLVALPLHGCISAIGDAVELLTDEDCPK